MTSAGAQPVQTSAGLPFQPANMTFKHIWYSVDPPGVSIHTASVVLTAIRCDHISCPILAAPQPAFCCLIVLDVQRQPLLTAQLC